MSQKRSAEEIGEPSRKYIRIRLASPSPERSGGSDTESIHSCQGYETELAKDTSDTSTSPVHNIEYEPTDTEKDKFYVTDDSDGEDSQTEADKKVLSEVSCDSLDNALLGDTSEENPTSPTSNSDVDPGLPRSDYLDFEKCLLCRTDRKNISYPYCSKCFAWKKNLFPSRPRRYHKIMKKGRTNTKSLVKNNEEIYRKTLKLKRNCVGGGPLREENDSDEDNRVDDSGVGSSGPQLSEVESSQLTEAVRSQSSVDVIDGSQSTNEISNSQLSEDVVEGPSLSEGERPQASEDVVDEGPSTSDTSARRLALEMCRICFSKPENGLFIHLNMAHVYGCYSCAKKIWYHSGGCPICRRKIFKVAKLFT